MSHLIVIFLFAFQDGKLVSVDATTRSVINAYIDLEKRIQTGSFDFEMEFVEYKTDSNDVQKLITHLKSKGNCKWNYKNKTCSTSKSVVSGQFLDSENNLIQIENEPRFIYEYGVRNYYNPNLVQVANSGERKNWRNAVEHHVLAFCPIEQLFREVIHTNMIEMSEIPALNKDRIHSINQAFETDRSIVFKNYFESNEIMSRNVHWIDPELGYLITQFENYVLFKSSNPSYDSNIQQRKIVYKKDEKKGVLPIQWESSTLNRQTGILVERLHWKITNWNLSSIEERSLEPENWDIPEHAFYLSDTQGPIQWNKALMPMKNYYGSQPRNKWNQQYKNKK